MTRPNVNWDAPYYKSIGVRSNKTYNLMPVIKGQDGTELRVYARSDGTGMLHMNLMSPPLDLSVIELTREQWFALKAAVAMWEMGE